jgi:hypothetical protein
MRFLFLFLICFNCFGANWKVELEGLGNKMFISAESDEELQEKLEFWANLKGKAFKGEWLPYSGNVDLDDPTYLVTKETKDEDGNILKLRYKPLNFSFKKIDITQEVEAEKQKKAQEKQEVD